MTSIMTARLIGVMHNYYVLKNLQEILNSGENF